MQRMPEKRLVRIVWEAGVGGCGGGSRGSHGWPPTRLLRCHARCKDFRQVALRGLQAVVQADEVAGGAGLGELPQGLASVCRIGDQALG